MRLLRWREAAPRWYDWLMGTALGLLAVGLRHMTMGHDYRLTYIMFFPFLTLASVIGRAAMGAAVIVVTVAYVRLFLTWNGYSTPYFHLAAYATSATAVVMIGNGLMRVLAAAEADRRRAQASESFHASLVRSSNDAIITKSLDGLITSWNPAAQRIFGYRADEVLGRPITMLFPDSLVAEEQVILDKIKRGEPIEHRETRRLTKDGTKIDVSATISPILNEAGKVVGASKIVRDITRQRRDADALRVSELHLRCALDGARAGSWLRDVPGKISYWSPRFIEMHGLDAVLHPPSVDNWLANIHPDDRARTLQVFRAAIDGDASEYFGEYRVTLPGGEERWIEISAKIERLPNGNFSRVAGICLDATERYKSLETLRRTNLDLARANDSLKKFSSIAAHDLQEPLRKLEQFSSLLQEECGPSIAGDGAFYLSVISDAARRMRALINALLDFSRAGNRPLTLSPIDMNEVMRKVQNNCASAIEEADACVELGDLPTLYGDAGLVAQLFQNLVSNALKYGKPGRRPVVRIAGEAQGQNVVFRVSDEGIGIARENQALIFEPFTRLNAREKVKGTGIGLAFCRTVCERHGWRLEVLSELGGGAEFVVTAPRGEGRLAA